MKALVLLSGGMDSATSFYQAVEDCGAENLIPVFFFYGQRSFLSEFLSAGAIAEKAGTKEPVQIDLTGAFENLKSALTGTSDTELPVGRTMEEIQNGGIPPSFVPGRNIIFLAFAFGLAQIHGANRIYAGMNDEDATGYPDCRKEFLETMEVAGSLGTENDVKIVLPVMGKTKAGVVLLGEKLGVPWENTSSCYQQVSNNEKPCGVCDSCLLRINGFKEAGVEDPLMKENA